MNTTQQHLSIDEIRDDLMLLKDGSAALILQSSAVNFGLLSEKEQGAIILSFAQMLNSLSYPIQVVIHSTRLDITSYLDLLESAQKLQTNPLLSSMILRYKDFIAATIKENEVLDKKFYIVIPLSNLELGLGFKNKEEHFKKISAMLLPRKDQINRQLNRINLKGTQLTSTELIKVFYDIYNSASLERVVQIEPVILSSQTKTPIAQTPTPITTQLNFNPQPIQNQLGTSPKNHPFVVEELTDQ